MKTCVVEKRKVVLCRRCGHAEEDHLVTFVCRGAVGLTASGCEFLCDCEGFVPSKKAVESQRIRW